MILPPGVHTLVQSPPFGCGWDLGLASNLQNSAKRMVVTLTIALCHRRLCPAMRNRHCPCESDEASGLLPGEVPRLRDCRQYLGSGVASCQ
jgi:hypothetical protein